MNARLKIWSVDELAETAAYEDGNLVGKDACRAGLSALGPSLVPEDSAFAIGCA